MKLKNIVRYGAVAALMALTMAVMVSCQKQEPAAESEPTDTQLMQEAAGDAKAPFYVLVVGNDSRVGTTQISLEDYAEMCIRDRCTTELSLRRKRRAPS